jgi:hypothetical protein
MRQCPPRLSTHSFFGDNPHRMNDTGNITQQGQQNVDPEMLADPDLQKHAQRRQQDGDNDANKIHDEFLMITRVTTLADSRADGYLAAMAMSVFVI